MPPTGSAGGDERVIEPTISGGSGTMIKAVVFDLDGTMIDSAGDLCTALRSPAYWPCSRGSSNYSEVSLS